MMLHQLLYQGLGFIFHSHPTQFANKPNELVRCWLVRRGFSSLLLCKRHFRAFSLKLSPY